MSNNLEPCRCCEGTQLKEFLDLQLQPLADRIVSTEGLQQDEPKFPLEVVYCEECSLIQISKTVSPEILFADAYPYYSSFSPALLKHSRDNVLDILTKKTLGSDSLVIELASNDGYLLKNYVEEGIPVLGIDPADGPANAANDIGVNTLNDFFTEELAAKLAKDGQLADVIHGNNVLAHVADTNGFVRGISSILKEDGLVVIECPYLMDLMDHCEFDTIYHEHLCYFSVTALNTLFRRNGLYLNAIKRLSIHGGSLRLYVNKFDDPQASVIDQLALEQEKGLDTFDYYKDFSIRVNALKDEVVSLLKKLKGEGHSIAAYGAAAKGSTLINYMGIGTDLVDFVVDRNTHKQGFHMPGQHIPILAPEALLEKKPDYTLMLTWNFSEEILQQQQAYRDQGGKFIIPIPELKIV